MLEIGNWVKGDQYSGRIIQFANAQIFGTPVFNYTRNFSYIWDEIKLPVTYASNLPMTKNILLEAGREYTREFLEGAQRDMAEMQKYLVVATMELKPPVYLKVTDKWVTLTQRDMV